MSTYTVDYYYLATGMEGNPDIKHYGTVNAPSKSEAIKIVAERDANSHGYDKDSKKWKELYEWNLSCMSARKVEE